MSGIFGVLGILLLCWLLLPMSGWWFARLLRQDGFLRLAAACLAGAATLAAAELLVYAFRLPQWFAAALVGVTVAISVRDLIATIRREEFAWGALLTWAGLSAMLSGVTLVYAVHGGVGAVWDWYEHWLRSLIFLEQGPVTTQIGPFILPSRGPLFNGAAALLLYLGGTAEYWAFQVIAIALNTLMCLPFSMVLVTIGGVSRRTSLPIAAAVCMLVPFFFWNNTFSWTKDLTAAFVLMAIYCYLEAYRKDDREGMAMALVWLAPGFLTHYLALVYAGVLGLHLLSTSWRNLPVRALVRAGVVWAVLIGPWFGYMMLNFGVRRTLGANTTVGSYYVARDAQGRQIPLPRVLIANLCTDLLPRALCRPLLPSPVPCLKVAVQGSQVANVPVACGPDSSLNGVYRILRYSGLLAVVLAAGLGAGSLFGRFGGDARFLLWFFAGGLVLNLLPVRWFDTGGSFSENLQAWCVLFFTVLARRLARLPRWALALLATAMILELGSIDWQDIREQTTLLPLANERRAGVGDPPLGNGLGEFWAIKILPAPQSNARFVTDSDYYLNYVIKIRGGALYYRDIHPQGFASACCVLLVIGAVLETAAFLFMPRRSAAA